MNRVKTALLLPLALAGGAAVMAQAPAAVERAMFGNTFVRNMVSDEKGLPADWDVKTGKNVKWWADVGSQAYAGPTVFGGKVFVGTNNDGRRNPKLAGDRGVVMAFDAANGDFLWQMAHEKLPAGRVNDWPQQGICSTPYAEGNRLYYTSNRATIVSLDVEGFKDGNDGPVTDEKEQGPTDADVVWEYDMIKELDVFPHNLAVSSPLVVDGILYATTGNGVDEGHINIPSPKAPSFVALDAKTGTLVWESNLPERQDLPRHVVEPDLRRGQGPAPGHLPRRRRLDLQPRAEDRQAALEVQRQPGGRQVRPGRTRHRQRGDRDAVLYDDKLYFGVGQDPEHGEGVGHFWCIDATKDGDITGTGVVWHRGGNDFRRTISTVAIKDDVVYASNLSGFLYALDAKTGQEYWQHDMLAAVWGSPFVADGRVYLGDEDGDVEVLKAGKVKQVLGSYNMGISVYSTPVAKDGVLYVLARNRLFALQQGAAGKPSTARGAEAAKP